MAERQAKELVLSSVTQDILLCCVEEEARGVASEALAQAKQWRRDRLEGLRKKFLRSQLHKYWGR